MYLINGPQIATAIDKPHGQRIDIGSYDRANLQHSSYYFRLGNLGYRWSDTDRAYSEAMAIEHNRPLVLGSHETVRVVSYETFNLDDKTMGIFGGVSDLAEMGVHLIHSPFIDPLFPTKGEGRLHVSLQNLHDSTAVVKLMDRIGKVAFFDISDTYPLELLKGSDSITKFARR